MGDPIYVKAGDTFFTRSGTLLGKLIRFGETDKNEAPGSVWANHAGVVVEDGWFGSTETAAVPAVVIEALWKTRKGPLVLSKGVQVRVFRPVPSYDAHELERFTLEAETYVGDTYGWWKLGVQLGDRLLFKGKKILGSMLFKKDRPICSFLAGFVNHMAQSKDRVAGRVLAGLVNGEAIYAFGVPPQACDPDGMLRWCDSHPDHWMEVFE